MAGSAGLAGAEWYGAGVSLGLAQTGFAAFVGFAGFAGFVGVSSAFPSLLPGFVGAGTGGFSIF